MGNSRFACFFILIILTTLSFARRQGKQFYNGFVKGDVERDESEGEVELSRQKLRILLRGLVTLLVNLFPDCLPKTEQKQDEGVKVFRQIIACPLYPLQQPVFTEFEQSMRPDVNQLIYSRNDCMNFQ